MQPAETEHNMAQQWQVSNYVCVGVEKASRINRNLYYGALRMSKQLRNLRIFRRRAT
jgi:hypothetical protein